tara:strand:- start:633 stop:980 length:348 start_codon:yes stop_codon:yes gene_type:complete
MKDLKTNRRKKIRDKVRSKITGSTTCPRLSVFRSNKEIYVQIIDDIKQITLVSSNSLKIKNKSDKKEQAFKTGEDIAKKAKSKGIENVKFDRSGYLYHGRIKYLADGARKGGLKF